ncbi:hypothetical protein [Halorubrum sp. BV1]|uniref:hypothetical protein n=1 Tax=Halorubrum sp. BV1 TaxID=1498500 RepID=UPI00067861F2|nr:hypothetical protein [Halorubrum sp. BV1]
MSDSWEADEPKSIDVDTFQEWLRHTAESRDLDEGELLDRLVSAYWVLDEMSDVVPGTPAGKPSASARPNEDAPSQWRSSNRHRPAAGARAPDDPAPSPWPATDDPTGGDVESGGENASSDDTSASDGDAADTPVSGTDAADAADTPSSDPDAAEIEELRDSLQTQLDLVQTVAELRRQVSDLSLDVEHQRSRQDGFTDRITDEITRLNQRVEQLDAAVDDDDLDRRLDAVEQTLTEFESAHAGLESAHDEFEAWVDREFDEIEALFERLIDRTDDLDDRLSDVERSTDTVEAMATARRGVAELRREAIDHGIDQGTCAHCESSVDLSMLTEPACPACDRSFTDLTPGRWWNPFSTATLHTEVATRDAVSDAEPAHPRDIVDGR